MKVSSERGFSSIVFLPFKLRGARLAEAQYIPLEERAIERDRPADMATETSSSSSATKPAIGIVSVGDMGLGIAKLLQAHEYQVLTTSAGRRQAFHVGIADCG
jgi:hypothetical protein